MEEEICEEMGRFIFAVKMDFIITNLPLVDQRCTSLCSLLQTEGRMKRNCKFTEVLQVKTVTVD